MTQAIDISHATFAYRKTEVLTDVSLQVNEGEFLGIIGPNGGGKTTLFRLILGFVEPDSGEVKVFGDEPQQMWRQMAYVPQIPQYDRDFPISVLELVLSGRLGATGFFGRYSRADREAARMWLERVGLDGLEKRPFGTLSGGQARRALLARALITEPRLLLLDEPTAGVDSTTTQQIYQLLQELQKETTILMVTHDLNAAIDLVERVVLVAGNVTTLPRDRVCEHFAVGLYHSPLIRPTSQEKGDC